MTITRAEIERTAAGARTRFRFAGGTAGVERMAASLVGAGFERHRHDTYAIGITLAGVQTFSYRGRQRACLPGQWHILHPDEPHDGMPGTGQGFAYRILYVDPALVHDALDGRPLPFVADPVLDARGVPFTLADGLRRFDDPLDELAATDLVTAVTDLLRRHASSAGGSSGGRIDSTALSRVRASLLDDPVRQHSAADLERVAGLDRWTVARQFRAAFGTSPSRFRTLRRLELARDLIARGVPLAAAAVEAGFADQPHLTRRFKDAYGLTPSAWRAATAG